jgi:signal peptidase
VDNNINDIQIGDIIVYYGTWTPTPENIVHRVIKKETKENGTVVYITKGDNIQTNPTPDPLEVQPDQIRFKVVSINNHELVIPKLGYITLLLRGL